MVTELTNDCNLDCIMCPRKKMKRKIQYMSFELFKKIIDEAKDFAEAIDLDLFGESLLHPDIFRMIRYVKKNNLFAVLNTNATLLNKDASPELISSGLDFLVLSFDSTDQDNYESIRRGSAYFKTLENINNFLELNDNKIFSVVQMVYMKKNMQEVNHFLKYWKNKKIGMSRLKPLLTLDPSSLYMNALPLRNVKDKPCIQLWKSMVICSDGTVVPCCNDYDKIHPLGDMNKDEIRTIWNNQNAKELRTRHILNSRKSVELCSRCLSFNPGLFLLAMNC
ncbi:MAG: hypothetical protein A2484_01410, partial [Nitrospirae bacterium RIFOXYC2_FULL_44_7]